MKLSRVAALTARFHCKARPSAPAWATEDTQEMETLALVNRRIEWAVESTGLLETLRSGLKALGSAEDGPSRT